MSKNRPNAQNIITLNSGSISAALLLIKIYKILISPLFTGSCRFVPSCSSYASEALKSHGILKGSWLAIRRLGRCQPFFAAGYDPVPVPESELSDLEGSSSEIKVL